MVFQLNDFTDSEDEPNTAPPSPVASTPRRGASGRNGRATPASPAGTSGRVSASPRAGGRDHGRGPSASSTSGHPLRITLRTAPPSDAPGPSTSNTIPPPIHVASSQRSSLSPPPPITLKLSKPPRLSLAEKATYSSSEDEQDQIPEPLYYAEDDVEADRSYAPHGSKVKKSAGKKKGGTPKKAASAKPDSIGASVFGAAPPGASVPFPSGSSSGSGAAGGGAGGKKKTYDWLAPSSVSASHPGPPGRAGSGKSQAKSNEESSVGGRDDSEMELDMIVAEITAPVVKPPPKKKQKKAAAAADGGPGKTWRKGQAGKKMKTLLAESYLDTASHDGSSPMLGGMMSADGTPEPLDLSLKTEQGHSTTRGNTPPFERADPAKLGFPVFSRPIVTQFFAPINGGDAGAFPRKEKVRSWKHHTSTMMGIGGGTLLYKAWARGPPSELGRLVQADREVKEIQRAAKKAGIAIPAPLFNDSALLPEVRPVLQPTVSTDSVLQLGAQGEEEGSEMGDTIPPVEEGSVSGAAGGSAKKAKIAKVPGPKKAPVKKKSTAALGAAGAGGAAKPKAKPRKSKLAQEIVPAEAEMGGEGEGIAAPGDVAMEE